jgi:hypothetical protein
MRPCIYLWPSRRRSSVAPAPETTICGAKWIRCLAHEDPTDPFIAAAVANAGLTRRLRTGHLVGPAGSSAFLAKGAWGWYRPRTRVSAALWCKVRQDRFRRTVPAGSEGGFRSYRHGADSLRDGTTASDLRLVQFSGGGFQPPIGRWPAVKAPPRQKLLDLFS